LLKIARNGSPWWTANQKSSLPLGGKVAFNRVNVIETKTALDSRRLPFRRGRRIAGVIGILRRQAGIADLLSKPSCVNMASE